MVSLKNCLAVRNAHILGLARPPLTTQNISQKVKKTTRLKITISKEVLRNPGKTD